MKNLPRAFTTVCYAALLAGSYSFGDFKLTAYGDSEDRGEGKMKVYGLAGAYSFGASTVSLGVAKARDVSGVAANQDDDATILGT